MTDRLDDEAVLPIIEQIYAAGCDPSLWPEVTAMCQGLLPGTGFSLLLSTSPSGLDAISCGTGYDPCSIADYIDHYHAMNPYLPIIDEMPSGKVGRVSKSVSRDWLLAQPFYHEWLKPAGDYTFGATLPIRDDGVGMLRLTYDIPSTRPDFEDVATEILQRANVHFHRAYQISWRLRKAEAAAAIGDALLEHLSGAVIVVDASAKIHGLNTRAQALLRQGRVFRGSLVDRLAFQAPQVESLFQRALRSVTTIDAMSTPTGFFVEIDGKRSPVIVLPIAQSSTVPATQGKRQALVQIGPSRAGASPPVALLRTLYQLTPAEARLVQRVAAGESLREISDANETSQSTVRNQLQSAMQKLNVHRQAELVGVLAALTPRLSLEE